MKDKEDYYPWKEVAESEMGSMENVSELYKEKGCRPSL